MNLADIHLVFFLSRAVPLSRWDEIGIFEREIALYEALRPSLAGLSLVTSGGVEDLAYQDRLGGIRILHNRWGLSPNAYSLLAPFLHWGAMRSGTIYRTNQLDGAWTAIIAGQIYRKPVIVRAGYLWAEFFRAEEGRSFKAAVIHCLQTLSFRKAHRIILTAEAMKRQVSETYGIRSERISVVPNYVDTDRFHPMPEVEPISGRVCYIGRLHPRKNLRALIQAVSRVPRASLVLIGQGEQREELEALALRCQADVRFIGVLQHDQVPIELNRSEVFILPSLFEGHPKALIEAMACGIAVVGTDVEGIRNVIRHGETGLLCPPTVEGITSALQRLLANRELGGQLGTAARTSVERECGLLRIVEIELATLQEFG
jgi:glycosyltransferase involved in cell wall biosynthesis